MEKRINELDLSRAGIISLQRNMPGENTSWTVEYTIGNIRYQVTGNARHGRPHGVDNDVMLALQTMFLRIGCPEHNRVETTARAVLDLFASSTGGSYYTLLRESLLRLAGTNWTMVRSTWDERTGKHQGVTSTHTLFQITVADYAVGERHPFEQRELRENSTMLIKMDDALAASIRAGFFLILDAELLARLAHPNARNLYRVLQGHRVQTDGSLAAELHLNLGEWLKACGLEDERIDNAKRLLEFAHQRLLDEGFLRSVQFHGRGRQGTVRYEFLGVALPELVDRLLAHKVSRPVAESLAADHPERIMPALQVLDEKLREGWKPRSLGASVVDAVRNPDKWGYAPLPPAEPTPASTRRAARKAVIQEVPEVPQDPRETARILLRLKLKRDPSPMAQDALAHLSPEGVNALLEGLKRPGVTGLELATTILSVPI